MESRSIPSITYDVTILATGYLEKFFSSFSSSFSFQNICLVTEDKLLALYGDKLKRSFGMKKNVFFLSFLGGEEQKTRKTKEELEDKMLEAKMGRDTLIVGFGGGVVLDMAGFLASTYMRGIPWIAIPSTLLAMVDVAMSGKTAVNTVYGKNLIGSFYLPSHTIISIDLLDTLPGIEWQNGFFEILKHALLFDDQLFNQLTTSPLLSSWSKEELLALIQKNIKIKKDLILKDFTDQNERKLLNFGHTIGHALEKASGYQMSHGLAVGLGIFLESYIAWKNENLSEKSWKQIHMFLKRFFPLFREHRIDERIFYDALLYDKKVEGKKNYFIAIRKIGNASMQDISFLDEMKVKEAFQLLQTIQGDHACSDHPC